MERDFAESCISTSSTWPTGGQATGKPSARNHGRIQTPSIYIYLQWSSVCSSMAKLRFDRTLSSLGSLGWWPKPRSVCWPWDCWAYSKTTKSSLKPVGCWNQQILGPARISLMKLNWDIFRKNGKWARNPPPSNLGLVRPWDWSNSTDVSPFEGKWWAHKGAWTSFHPTQCVSFIWYDSSSGCKQQT